MSTTAHAFDPAAELNEIQVATDRVLASISGLDADALAAPRSSPAGRVGTSARISPGNADSLINLLTWARTGVETPAYGPGDARERAIEAGASRSPERAP